MWIPWIRIRIRIQIRNTDQSYAVPYPAELRRTLLSFLHPTELCCILLSYYYTFWLWAKQCPTEQGCTLLSTAAPF
jgi:hypothetical protein